MRLALLALAVTLAACGGLPAQRSSGTADMGHAADLGHYAPDMAHARTAPADMAEPSPPPIDAPDMADAPQPPPSGPDMAEPACPLLPACDGTVVCCNGGSCINGYCYATAGHHCDGATGPVCFESQCWPDGSGPSSGTCR